MPTDAVVYTTILTLIVFLLFRIPGIWQGIDLEKPQRNDQSGGNAAAIALGVCGILTLTIQNWMAPTHTIGGVNYADVWHVALSILGSGLIVSGAILKLISRLTQAVGATPRASPPLPDMCSVWNVSKPVRVTDR